MQEEPKTTVRLDETQFDKILAAAKPPRRKRLKIEEFAKLVEVAAIVVGGAWVLIMFFSHVKKFDELTNRTLDLASQAQSNSIAAASQSPLKATLTIDLDPPLTNQASFQEYPISLTVEVTNPSQHLIDIQESEVQFYMGDLKLPKNEEYAVMLNRPKEPSEKASFEIAEPIKWHLIQTIHYYSVAEIKRHKSEPDNNNLPYSIMEGHPAFGVLLHDETANSTIRYRVRSNPDGWVGFIVKFKLAGEQDWRWKADQFRDLASSKPKVTTE